MQITATALSKEYGLEVILDEISFTISEGEKIGLVGRNGTGKSTLLKILAGEEQPDSGTLRIPPDMVIGYVPQDTKKTTSETILEYLVRIGSDRQSSFEIPEHKTKAILEGLGMKNIDLNTPLRQLSSGQKIKIFLTAALLLNPDLLLLDEPTNNLDLTALIWLEGFLRQIKIACVIVSHDRKFLDGIVGTIFEIDWQTKGLTITHGKYSDFIERAKKERIRQEQEYEANLSERQRTQDLVKKTIQRAEKGSKYTTNDNNKALRDYFRNRSAVSGRSVRAYKKRLENMDELERPAQRRKLAIDIDTKKIGGVRDIRLYKVVVGYQDGIKIGPITWNINFGDRIILLGDNGVGKSTLINTILGKLKPLSGEVEIGGAVRWADFTQEHDNLPKEKTLLEFFEGETDLLRNEIYNLVFKYGFGKNDIDKELGDFSPGGRARILFALFSIKAINTLFLDEPTNHLDMDALDALEEVVQNYQGTIVIISHDRHLLGVVKPTDILLIASDGSISRQKDIDSYIVIAEKKARELNSILKHKLN